MNPKLKQIAKIVEQEREISNKARALRAKVSGLFSQGYYSAVGIQEDQHGKIYGITLNVSHKVFLEMVPETVKPTLETFSGEYDIPPKPYARLRYGFHCVGEYAPGKRLWLESWSDKFDIPEAPAKEENVA